MTIINWDNRLVVITGARGIGKTTLLLQYIRENLIHRSASPESTPAATPSISEKIMIEH